MRLTHQWWSVLVAAVLGGLVGVTAWRRRANSFFPVLSHPRRCPEVSSDTACRWLYRLFDPAQCA